MTKRATTTEAILESISDGVFTVDSDWRITTFNRAAEEITGTPRRRLSERSAPMSSDAACVRQAAP